MDNPTPQPYGYTPLPPAPQPALPKPWATWIIVGSTVAVFLLQLHYARTTGEDIVGDTLGCSAQALADGRIWTLVTYAWVHAVVMFGDPGYFWLHITANMICLWSFGPLLELLIGHWRYVGLYFGGAVAAALTWFLIAAQPGSSEPIIGASGSVFAVLVALGAAAPRQRITVLLFFILPLRITLGNLAILICVLEAGQMIFGLLPEIAHSAHLGGAAFGFAYIQVLKFLARRRQRLPV